MPGQPQNFGLVDGMDEAALTIERMDLAAGPFHRVASSQKIEAARVIRSVNSNFVEWS